VSQLRRGYLFGILAYVLWGFFPLYFKLLRPATPTEILANRIVWSFVAIAVILAVARRWRTAAELVRRPRVVAGAALAATLVGLNWATYIYGVNSDQVVETSLGYFVNPLVTVALGVVVLRENLRRVQWVAVGIGAVAVAVLSVDYGRPPYIALTLAVTFGLYGLVKKRLELPPAEGLLVESGVLAPAALVYLGWLASHHQLAFGAVSPAHTALLIIAGPVTAIPLMLFASSANRIPLSALGILQYLAPVLQLACGVLVLHEPMPTARLAGFALVWLALGVFTADAVRSARRSIRAQANEAVPTPAAT
jgi:chloramphenicol-sensitive protein RarD